MRTHKVGEVGETFVEGRLGRPVPTIAVPQTESSPAPVKLIFLSMCVHMEKVPRAALESDLGTMKTYGTERWLCPWGSVFFSMG